MDTSSKTDDKAAAGAPASPLDRQERGAQWPGMRPERRRQRQCPSCSGTSILRGCRVPGVQLQVVAADGERRSGLIGLYSDVCVDCGLTSFYARRTEVAEQLEQLGTTGHAREQGADGGEGQ